MKKAKDNIIKVATGIFSILFILIVFNAIFFNSVIQIQFFPIVLITGIIIEMGMVILLYKTKIFGLYNKISKIINNNRVLVWIIIFILQLFLINLIYAKSGWDCITLLDNSFNLYKGIDINSTYFSIYPNNILSLIILKYVYVIVGLFTNINAENYYLVAIVFNVLLVDFAAILTTSTCRKILGEKTTFISYLFIIPLIVFFPSIIVPYTDTFSLFIPIAIFYLYLKIKDNTKMKYVYALLEGVLVVGGYLLKPTSVIIAIAIVLVEAFYSNFKNVKNKNKVIDFIAMILIFVVGAIGTYGTFSYLKEKNISKYISQDQFEKKSVPFTHFIMMGMQSYNIEEKPCYGAWNEFDAAATQNISGQKAKKEYNIEIIKQRLKDFGLGGYIKFVYNKINWIASDGTFYYWQEGTQKYLPENQSAFAKHIQKYFNIDTTEYQKITANFLEVLWIMVLIGILFSYKDMGKTSNILKTSIIGIILFIVIFEGRSRYLYNYITIFIIVGTIGIRDILKYLDSKILKFKIKKDKI